jgi:hypothetical protein
MSPPVRYSYTNQGVLARRSPWDCGARDPVLAERPRALPLGEEGDRLGLLTGTDIATDHLRGGVAQQQGERSA